ncbi:DUF2927 domain-containing protein [Arenibaculum pallidiluteum]|uniref:DUF2927 domain-containing protein n=1 Tax=Arenibaculum pallidiluteum TaxID=2812559 RepID=UPI001A97477E|nr:DUF2927 domain-containing protein [Arenibaculum pallidiluteum]
MTLCRIGGILAAIGIVVASAFPAASAEIVSDLAEPDLPPVYTRPWQAVEATTEWVERISRLFISGVVSDEGHRQREVRKWSGPVRVAVRGDAAADFLEAVADTAADLTAATGLPISVSLAPGDAAPIELMITWRREFWPARISPRGPRTLFTCMALPSSRGGALRASRILINAGVVGADGARACILEEMAQSLGLLGEVEDEPGSLLSDQIGYQHLGAVDALLLNVLYDPRLPVGMPADDAAQRVRAIVAEKLGVRRDALYVPLLP